MNRGALSVVAIVVAISAAAAGGGFLAGRRAGQDAVAGRQAVARPDAGADTGSAREGRKILFYRNPMGLADTSSVPKKDPMGMDYLPVFEGDEAESAPAGQIRISIGKVQKLGVRTEPAVMSTLDRAVSAVGRIEPDERRIHVIAPKFEGYVERLKVNATGQLVARGQTLFEAYSPELVAAQREYAIAARGLGSLKDAGSEAQAGMRQLAESGLARLRNWDVSGEQIKALEKSGMASRTLSFRSPVAGVVTEKKVLQGMRFMPGEPLYQVTDLSSVWVIADVFEQDIGAVKTGARAQVFVDAYPEKIFEGRVSHVYPTLSTETRTLPVRIELDNPGMLLKPGMFARVEMRMAARASALTVPFSAIIDSGVRRIVFVQAGEGRFEPREVKTGIQTGDRVEILEGVNAGENVVVAANFLIDAESNLKAALGSFGHAGHDKPARTDTRANGREDAAHPHEHGHAVQPETPEASPHAGH